MQTSIVALIGILAVAYVARKVWKTVTNQSGCGCGDECPSKKDGCCCSSQQQ